jgi:hypothetical protein
MAGGCETAKLSAVPLWKVIVGPHAGELYRTRKGPVSFSAVLSGRGGPPPAVPPLKKGSIGGLRPPFFVPRTPTRSVGYAGRSEATGGRVGSPRWARLLRCPHPARFARRPPPKGPKGGGPPRLFPHVPVRASSEGGACALAAGCLSYGSHPTLKDAKWPGQLRRWSRSALGSRSTATCRPSCRAKSLAIEPRLCSKFALTHDRIRRV